MSLKLTPVRAAVLIAARDGRLWRSTASYDHGYLYVSSIPAYRGGERRVAYRVARALLDADALRLDDWRTISPSRMLEPVGIAPEARAELARWLNRGTPSAGWWADCPPAGPS